MMNREKIIPALVITAVFAALVAATATREGPSGPPPPLTVPDTAVSATTPAPEPPASPAPDFAGSVAKNASFYDIMTACGADPVWIYDVARRTKDVYDLGRLRPGQRYEVFRGEGGIEKVVFSIDDLSYLEVSCGDDTITAERIEYPYEIAVREASGIITSSLFASMIEQGLPVELGHKLTDIYAWDIDFFTEIRRDDYFRVIYEEIRLLDGPDHTRKTDIGLILAAEFNTSGRSRYALLFDNEGGMEDYFDQDGRSLRKQLLRAPLSYTRISSSYSRRRFHPVLHRWAPHLGIDYAAPTGTPVMSTGDGTVIAASRTRANGNYVKIRHNNSFISYYLHLSRFGKGIRNGVRVEQGQVIGYVGATGYATGPHLDYRVKKNGRFVNPRKLKLPPAEPVREANMTAFAARRDSLIASLAVIPIRDPRGEYFVDAADAAGGPGHARESRGAGSPLPH